jgi:hypothetical protein
MLVFLDRGMSMGMGLLVHNRRPSCCHPLALASFITCEHCAGVKTVGLGSMGWPYLLGKCLCQLNSQSMLCMLDTATPQPSPAAGRCMSGAGIGLEN